MPILPDGAVPTLQVVTILVLAPLVSGIIARVEAIIQQRQGPRIPQPSYDRLELPREETVLPAPAGPVLRAAQYVGFAALATVPLLIPILITFPLPLGYMADFSGVGLTLALASFSISVAAIHSGSPYARWDQAGCAWRHGSRPHARGEVSLVPIGWLRGARCT